MKMLNFGKLVTLASILATLGAASVASAQSVRHDVMDARAARADLMKLSKDRRRAVKYGNWAKVAQDDRLIASDRLFIRRDIHKIRDHQR